LRKTGRKNKLTFCIELVVGVGVGIGAGAGVGVGVENPKIHGLFK